MKTSKRWLWSLLIPSAAALGVFYVYSLYTPDLIDENEREASKALKSLTSADADFRANDRDCNHINDFWTGDVAGLYYITPDRPDGVGPIRLIPREVAEADAKSLKPIVSTPIPYHGYFFVALDGDDGMEGIPEGLYKVDTGGVSFHGQSP